MCPRPSAHAATYNYTTGLLRVQVLVRDEHPLGAACWLLCTPAASTSCSRWMEPPELYRCVARAEHMLGTSASVRDQPASVAVRAWECPRAIWKGAGESTLEVCDSIDVLRLYVSEGVRMLTTYAHIARPIFMCDGWTAEGGPSARPRRNAGRGRVRSARTTQERQKPVKERRFQS